MLELKQEIEIYPPAYKDVSGNIVKPNAITFKVLDIQYIDQPFKRLYFLRITRIPNPILLFSKDDYNYNITKEQANIKFSELLGADPAAALLKYFPRTLEQDPHGPGTILAEMFSVMGIKSVENCSCKRHALKMNEMGNQWCEENVDTIVEWLKEEAKNRKLMFYAPLAKMLVNRAIKKSKKILQKGV